MWAMLKLFKGEQFVTSKAMHDLESVILATLSLLVLLPPIINVALQRGAICNLKSYA
jgi:hypothetical protein